MLISSLSLEHSLSEFLKSVVPKSACASESPAGLWKHKALRPTPECFRRLGVACLTNSWSCWCLENDCSGLRESRAWALPAMADFNVHTIVDVSSGNDSVNATWFLFLFKIDGEEGHITLPTIKWSRGQVVLAPGPTQLRGNKPTLSPGPAKLSCLRELSLAVPKSTLSWNSQLPCSCPVGGHGWHLRTRKPYPQKQCVPWQHITLGRSPALVWSIRSEFQRGVASIW